MRINKGKHTNIINYSRNEKSYITADSNIGQNIKCKTEKRYARRVCSFLTFSIILYVFSIYL